MSDVNPLQIELRDPAFLAEPYPTYRTLRERAPVYHHAALGVWLVSRYKDVVAALRDPERFSSRRLEKLVERRVSGSQRAALEPFIRIVSSWLWMQDPPDHTRIRGLVNKGFRPRAIELLHDKIAATVERALDRVVDAKHMDFMEEFAYPVAATTPLQLYGLPIEDLPLLRQWTEDMTVFIGGSIDPRRGPAEANRSLLEMRDYFVDAIRARRVNRTDDLISRLIDAEEDGKFLDEEELCAQLMHIQTASYFTTMDMFGNGMLALLRNPRSLADLRARPEMTRAALEELLRFDGPVQLTHRLTTSDVPMGDVTIPSGSLVFLLRGSANRDPERFPDPDRLDLERANNHHVAMGEGIHYCTGAALARLEGEIGFKRLLARLPNLRLARGEASATWRTDNLQFRGLKSLDVVFD